MKLKDLLEQESVADKDAKAALKIKNDLMKVGKFIETGFAMIDAKLSSFNSPGLKQWLAYAIKKNLGTTGKPGFDRRAFEKHLSDWYKGR